MTFSLPECIFFDLDDTLYSPRLGIWQEISRRINRYLVERIGVRETEVDGIRERFFQAYGTTLNGLRAEYTVDPEDYLAYVHDIPLDRYLNRDSALHNMLSNLHQRKYIFSNADRPYILRVLEALGIQNLFDGIIDIFALGFACKPMDLAYWNALARAGSPAPATCWLVDDLPQNLMPASRLGMTTVLVHQKKASPGADYSIEDIYHLETLVAEADGLTLL